MSSYKNEMPAQQAALNNVQDKVSYSFPLPFSWETFPKYVIMSKRKLNAIVRIKVSLASKVPKPCSLPALGDDGNCDRVSIDLLSMC